MLLIRVCGALVRWPRHVARGKLQDPVAGWSADKQMRCKCVETRHVYGVWQLRVCLSCKLLNRHLRYQRNVVLPGRFPLRLSA